MCKYSQNLTCLTLQVPIDPNGYIFEKPPEEEGDPPILKKKNKAQRAAPITKEQKKPQRSVLKEFEILGLKKHFRNITHPSSLSCAHVHVCSCLHNLVPLRCVCLLVKAS